MLSDWIARWGHTLPPQAWQELQAALNPVPLATAPKGASEASVAAHARLAASRDYGAPLWRNNNGAAYDKAGRLIRFGLGNESPALSARWKSSDLIGALPVVVRPEHVGQRFGLFLAVETKKPGWKLTAGDKRGQAQAAFIKSVCGFGGVAGFVQSEQDLKNLLDPWAVKR